MVISTFDFNGFLGKVRSGSLQEVLQIHDVLARVYLARLCYILSRAKVLDGMFSIQFFSNV